MAKKMKRTHGPWRRGKPDGAIVADHPVCTINGADEVEYYGGHLIAESVAPQNIDAIILACNHFEAVVEALREVERGFSGYDSENRCVFRCPTDRLSSIRAVLAAIDKES